MPQFKTPKAFFGRQPGDDRVMIHWDLLCAYYRYLARVSDKLQLEEMGKTSEGNDFLILYVSSPENLARLDEYREISLRLADPRGLTEAEIDSLACRGKAIVFQSYGLHSNEIGGPQMVPLMLHELLTSNAPRIRRILEEVVFIISPCSEPDGEIVISNWYQKYLDTEFEGFGSPYLRHNWAGHSNNRDALRESVVESKYLNDILIRRFMPQIFQDHHHQSPDENRMSIAPFCDPICAHMAPLVHRETAMYGSHMAMALSASGHRGIVSGDPFFCDFPVSSFYGNAGLHNIAGMLTESADARIATPIYVTPEMMKGNPVRDHVLEPCAACPDPWEGGWWRLSDIVSQMYTASMALLEYAAANRQQILRRMAQKALSQTARGHLGPIKAYLIPPQQHDLSAAAHLITLLHNQRVEMFRLKKDIAADGGTFPAGSIYIPLAQPNYAVAQVMLAEEPYSKRALQNFNAGNNRLDDAANLCMSLAMGVVTEKLPFEIGPDGLDPVDPAGIFWERPLRCSENESYRAINRLLHSGKHIYKTEEDSYTEEYSHDAIPVRKLRIGLLKLSATGNTEEGFTRNLLQSYGFDYRIVMDREIRDHGVPADVGVLIIPGDPSASLRDGDRIPEGRPAEYRSGLGTDGPWKLLDFVSHGGRLVVWEKACSQIIEWFHLDIADRSVGLSPREYMTASSQLNGRLAEKDDPLVWGMPDRFTLTHTDGPILVPNDSADNIEVLAHIDPECVLKNGILRGGHRLAGTPCVLRACYGSGQVILYTFAPQFRMQQDGTYKLLFNALYDTESETK